MTGSGLESYFEDFWMANVKSWKNKSKFGMLSWDLQRVIDTWDVRLNSLSNQLIAVSVQSDLSLCNSSVSITLQMLA